MANNPPQTTSISLSDIFVSGVTGNQLATSSSPSTILVGPTAAGAEIGGRIVTAQGRGVSRAQVKLTDQNGEVRYALTNAFGYYRFEDTAVGQTYVISAVHKRYRFESKVLSVNGSVSEVNLTAIE